MHSGPQAGHFRVYLVPSTRKLVKCPVRVFTLLGSI